MERLKFEVQIEGVARAQEPLSKKLRGVGVACLRVPEFHEPRLRASPTVISVDGTAALLRDCDSNIKGALGWL
ncbi:hypothetical protein ACH79_26020 [Bradyrhizobium sp. CCBAU 051011]|nr:hypothetical protein ACH79_26020 [Bradyrhizobium sp. CCBAU 051011]